MSKNEIDAQLKKLGFRNLPFIGFTRDGIHPNTTEHATMREVGSNNWTFDTYTEANVGKTTV